MTQVIQQAAIAGFSIFMVRQGIITLMEKPNRDLLHLDNWRPLSLLNTEYKVLSKVIANRLANVLPTIINKQQVGFMKNRGLTENVFDLVNIAEYCKLKEIDAFLINFDFQKAFEMVDHTVLFQVMSHFNFGQKYTQYIKNLYRDIESCTMNLGYTGRYIKIQQGLRQGCPLTLFPA